MIAANYLTHNPLLNTLNSRAEKLQSEQGLLLNLSSVKGEDMVVRSSCISEVNRTSVFCSKLNKLSNTGCLVPEKMELNNRFICYPINPSAGLKKAKVGCLTVMGLKLPYCLYHES